MLKEGTASRDRECKSEGELTTRKPKSKTSATNNTAQRTKFQVLYSQNLFYKYRVHQNLYKSDFINKIKCLQDYMSLLASVMYLHNVFKISIS